MTRLFPLFFLFILSSCALHKQENVDPIEYLIDAKMYDEIYKKSDNTNNFYAFMAADSRKKYIREINRRKLSQTNRNLQKPFTLIDK